MKRLLSKATSLNRYALLFGLVFLSGGLTSCATMYEPPKEPVPKIARTFDRIALLPTQFVSAQPDSFCHDDIGDDLRSTMARRLRIMGYQATVLPDHSPQSFALNPPSPEPGSAPELIQVVPDGYDAAFGIWVDHYLATGLCDSYGGSGVLEMNVTVVLYSLPDGKELGRWHAEEWDNVSSSSQDAVWRVLEGLSDDLLAGLP